MRIVLVGGRVLDPHYDRVWDADVVIEDGRITAVGPGAAVYVKPEERETRIVDCTGRWVVPGFVDVHTHLREPGQEHKEDIASGTTAAAAGGFTTVCAMPNTTPVNDVPEITELMVSRAREGARVRVYPIGAITRGLQGRELTAMPALRLQGCVGFSDDGRCVTDETLMRAALQQAKTLGAPLIQHAEDHAQTVGALMHDGAISRQLGLKGWPRAAEDDIVARDLKLVAEIGARYHVAHASTRGTVALLREAKSRGLPVTAEATPHHLTLTDEALLGYSTACKVNPPLREREDVNALIDGLSDGTIDCVATDHAPHASSEKNRVFAEAPHGMIGLETALPLLLALVRDRRVPLLRLLGALSVAPAKMLGDVASVGVGARADVTVIDPELRWTADTFRSRSRNSPFTGWEMQGRVVLTLVAGEVVFELERAQ